MLCSARLPQLQLRCPAITRVLCPRQEDLDIKLDETQEAQPPGVAAEPASSGAPIKRASVSQPPATSTRQTLKQNQGIRHLPNNDFYCLRARMQRLVGVMQMRIHIISLKASAIHKPQMTKQVVLFMLLPLAPPIKTVIAASMPQLFQYSAKSADDCGVLPSQATSLGQRIRLPGQTRVTPEEYKEFLDLGHGDIFQLDIDRQGNACQA